MQASAAACTTGLPIRLGARYAVSIYLIASAISGAVLAGAVMYLLQVAIAKTGVLDRFESGRTQELV